MSGYQTRITDSGCNIVTSAIYIAALPWPGNYCFLNAGRFFIQISFIYIIQYFTETHV